MVVSIIDIFFTSMRKIERELVELAKPGTLLHEEGYSRDVTDHAEYERYIRFREKVTVGEGNIMSHWTHNPIVSEGFKTCYFSLGTRPETGDAQAGHISRSEFFPTDMYAYEQTKKSWHEEGDNVIMVWNNLSIFAPGESVDLQDKFKDRYSPINLNSNSRFGVIYDPEKRIILVQLTDEHILRVYQSF